MWNRALGMTAAIWLAAVTATCAAEAPPAPPSPSQARLVGDYGDDKAAFGVLERDGVLYVRGAGGRAVPLSRLAEGLYAAQPDRPGGPSPVLTFAGGRGPADAVALDGHRLARRDIGAEVVARIQAGVYADPSRVRAEALAATPPAEPAPARAADLVDLASLNAGFRFDIRYATTNNFMGFALYDRPAAWLQRPAAEALVRVQAALRKHGYGLLIHDAYRPWYVTAMFWDATPPESRMFVADPAQGSRHNRGGAVDLTLYDLATGRPVEMPGRYDEMSDRSYADYGGGTTRQRWLRDLLRREMEREGFAVLAEEWWHFDYRDWRDYAIGTAGFDRLGAGPAR